MELVISYQVKNIQKKEIFPKILFIGFVLPCLLILTVGCATTPKIQTSGVLAGQKISTTVDSIWAKYYLENYSIHSSLNPEYDERINNAIRQYNIKPLDNQGLSELSKTFSTDFATMCFVDYIYRNPTNRKAANIYHSYLNMSEKDSIKSNAELSSKLKDYMVVFIPGLYYKKDTTTGADFLNQRRILNQAGIKTFLIETNETGFVEENAAIIAKEIIRLSNQYNKIILVSASKGGPEVALTIGKLLSPVQVKNIKVWISIGGILRGSPLIEQYLKWPRLIVTKIMLFLRGLSIKFAENMGYKKRKETFEQLIFPQDILYLQFVGVPLSGQVSSKVWGRYNTLKNLGPNDGLTTLSDEIIPGGIVITEIGLDHYYKDPDIDKKTIALAFATVQLMESEK